MSTVDEDTEPVPSYEAVVSQLGRLSAVASMEPSQAQDHDEIVRSLRRHTFRDPRILAYEVNFTWHIPHYQLMAKPVKQGAYVRSPAHIVGDYSWTMRLYPHKPVNDVEYLGLYLDVAPLNKRRIGWRLNTRYGLVAWNPSLPHIYQDLKANDSTFTYKDPAWGTSKFCRVSRLETAKTGQEEGLLHDGTLNITAYIQVF